MQKSVFSSKQTPFYSADHFTLYQANAVNLLKEVKENSLDRIILASTKEGDLVLDPWTGSSTTGISACRLKRSFIGIDMERSYLELSVERFKEVLNSPQIEMAFKKSS